MAFDLVGLAQFVDDAPRQRRRAFHAANRGLQHDEFVAAEARHKVRVAHDGAQPVGDRAQQRIAGRVPERVVHLLELVEIDEQHREVAVALHRGQRELHLVVEEDAVRQAGQRVVARQMVDLRLGILALGHVLDQHDRAAALHRLECERERASVLGIDREVAVELSVEAALDLAQKALQRRRVERSGLERALQQLTRQSAPPRRRDMQDLLGALVGHDQPAVRIEHAQAVRHVVERGVEAPGDQRHVARRNDRIEKRAAQPVGDLFQAEEKRKQHADQHRQIGVPHQDQRGRHRDAGAHELRMDQKLAAEVPAGNADHVRQNDREREKLNHRIGGVGESKKAPRPQQRHEGGGAEDVAQLPAHRIARGSGPPRGAARKVRMSAARASETPTMPIAQTIREISPLFHAVTIAAIMLPSPPTSSVRGSLNSETTSDV